MKLGDIIYKTDFTQDLSRKWTMNTVGHITDSLKNKNHEDKWVMDPVYANEKSTHWNANWIIGIRCNNKWN